MGYRTAWLVAISAWLMATGTAFAGTRTIELTGTVDDLHASITVNGTSAPVTNGAFASSLTLSEGSNTITVVATDAIGNKSTVSLAVGLDTIAPVITISSPTDGQTFGPQQ